MLEDSKRAERRNGDDKAGVSAVSLEKKKLRVRLLKDMKCSVKKDKDEDDNNNNNIANHDGEQQQQRRQKSNNSRQHV